MLADHLFRLIIKEGSLQVTYADGQRKIYGDGSGDAVAITLRDRKLEWQIFLNPKLILGEAYMDERLTVEQGGLYGFLRICMRNAHRIDDHPYWRTLARATDRVRALVTFEGPALARQNISHHYDLSGKLYELFLDRDRQYSCAYFPRPEMSLDDAQMAKKRHLASKLLLDRPDLKVLDIGSGWGGLALYLNEIADADVTGLTLSQEQLAYARERAEKAGVTDKVRFELCDYRQAEGKYDRIISVGMFEHVGPRNFAAYFHQANELLADDGVFLLHSIGRSEPPGDMNPWIIKHIFPGGHIPALSEVIEQTERSGLRVNDIEILNLHYAETLKHWRQRFNARRDEARALYDERFCRMWDFYLTACEVSFRHETSMVFQMQLTKRQEAVPMTRDYMIDWERGGRLDQSYAAE
jgi:cyclopropane-fatty-acyl-phospholipid synthase